jgi:hypothetical protein
MNERQYLKCLRLVIPETASGLCVPAEAPVFVSQDVRRALHGRQPSSVHEHGPNAGHSWLTNAPCHAGDDLTRSRRQAAQASLARLTDALNRQTAGSAVHFVRTALADGSTAYTPFGLESIGVSFHRPVRGSCSSALGSRCFRPTAGTPAGA